jgi:glycosyltransferase involved in cell wall biosynthesis
MTGNMDISAIVPIGGRYDDSGELVTSYLKELADTGKNFELICVVDGEREDITNQILELAASEKRIRLIQLAKEFGEATAITAGLQYSSGRVILTLPAYYQIRPTEIRKLIDELDTSDVAVGARWPRSSKSKFETMRRNLFHWLVGFVTGERFSDLGCGARAVNRAVLDELPLYGDQHRFLPILAAQRGFQVSEINVAQSELDRNEQGYGPRIYLRRSLDIFSMFFLVRFTKKPLRFFGTIGSATFLTGAVILSLVVGEKIFLGSPLADRPALLLSSLLVVLGLQLFALGLLGELIIFTHARDIKEYSVERVVNQKD